MSKNNYSLTSEQLLHLYTLYDISTKNLEKYFFYISRTIAYPEFLVGGAIWSDSLCERGGAKRRQSRYGKGQGAKPPEKNSVFYVNFRFGGHL